MRLWVGEVFFAVSGLLASAGLDLLASVWWTVQCFCRFLVIPAEAGIHLLCAFREDRLTSLCFFDCHP